MKEERNEKTGRSVSGSGAENRLENLKVVESNKKANSITLIDCGQTKSSWTAAR